MIRLLRIITLGALLLVRPAADAHEMSIAEFELREVTPGEFLTTWVASNSAAGKELRPVWPDGCRAEEAMLRCGAGGLGRLAMEGVGQRYSAAVVRVNWLDGQSTVVTLTSAQPTAQLYGSADDRRGMGEVAIGYTVLGVEHILTGVDHLLFVVALLFLVGFNRRLVWTITAFTTAHSMTLALSALGWLTLRSPPVEATIALSIVLVAGEALHKGPTLARRWPAVVAFLFGLVHGLGFAGALKEIGLPENHMLLALLTFNVGVELGQLLVVALALLAWHASSRWPRTALARAPILYTIGAVAAYWSIARVAAIAS